MRALFILCMILNAALAAAEVDYPRHMIQITARGLGAGAAYDHTDPRSDSKFKDYDVLHLNFVGNYAYSITKRLQLGLLLSNQNETRSFKTSAGQNGEVKYTTLLVGPFLTWNLSPDFMNSWYIGFGLTWLNHEEEFAHNVFDYLEDDKNATTYELYFGKRMSLKGIGISNITFSPAFAIFAQRARKDYEDDGLQDHLGINIDFIKFDVLF